MDGVRRGDERAFEEMLIISYDSLYRFAKSVLRSEEDAKDAVQEVLINVWRLGDRWNPSGSAISYLLASVRNQALKSRRARDRFADFYSEADPTQENVPLGGDIDSQKNQLDDLIEDEAEQLEALRVEHVVNNLRERYRTVYILRYREGLSIAEVASVLETSYKAAEHLIHRATSQVIKALKKDP